MKIISDEKLRAYEQCEIIYQRLQEAHRWLSEFDWLLAPFWDYIFSGSYETIDTARNKMRRLNEIQSKNKVDE